jgi:hypothetical protein
MMELKDFMIKVLKEAKVNLLTEVDFNLNVIIQEDNIYVVNADSPNKIRFSVRV